MRLDTELGELWQAGALCLGWIFAGPLMILQFLPFTSLTAQIFQANWFP